MNTDEHREQLGADTIAAYKRARARHAAAAAVPVAAHRVTETRTQLGTRFITCACRHTETGGAGDTIAEQNMACHVRTANEAAAGTDAR